MTKRYRSFLVLTAFFVFSLLIGCSGSGTGNGAAGSNSAKGDDSAFPPLPPKLANAKFELLDGTKFSLADKKGKVLLVNIWGTWCGPCRAEMPHLIALQNKYGEQGFEVIGLNIGDGAGGPEPVDLIRSFAEKMGLNYTIAISSNENTLEFYRLTRQEVVPQTIVVDRDGRLRGVLVGSGQRVYDSMYETVGKVMAE